MSRWDESGTIDRDLRLGQHINSPERSPFAGTTDRVTPVHAQLAYDHASNAVAPGAKYHSAARRSVAGILSPSASATRDGR